jgi:hypothetical protein
MTINFDYSPKPTLKAGFFGLEKRGKTHGMCTLAVAACKVLQLPGDIVCIASENWVDDWHTRLAKATGKRVAPFFTTDPTEALEAFRECEKSAEVSLVLVDSMSEILQTNRKRWIAKNGKGIPVHEYGKIDLEFARLASAMKDSKLHWIATMREADDTQEIDGKEIVIGKKAKASDFGYVPRLLVHCTLAKGKSGTDHKWHVTDCGNPSADVTNGTPASWDPYLERLK